MTMTDEEAPNRLVLPVIPGVCPMPNCGLPAVAELVAALGDMEEVTKGGQAVVKSEKGSYTYRYLELPDLLTETRRALAAHHYAVLQDATPAGPPTDHLSGRLDPGSASEQSIKLWKLIRDTGMDNDQVRDWAAQVLDIDPDWHTRALSPRQVSVLIDRLKNPPPA